VISGPHDLFKEGSGAITLAGATANTYLGATYVHNGTLVLNKSVANGAIPGDLNILFGSTVRLGANEQIADTASVDIQSGGTLDLNNYNETIGTNLSLYESTITTGSGILTLSPNCTVVVVGTSQSYISGNVNMGSGNCTMDVEGGWLDIAASLSGTANLILSGPRDLELLSSNSYSGSTIVLNGDLTVKNPWALGTTSSGTIVSNQGSLLIEGNTGITNESLTLYGPGGAWSNLATEDGSIDYWVGPITLNGNCQMMVVDPFGALHLNGPISGAGSLEMAADPQQGFPSGGQLFLEGSTANTYTGSTTVDTGFNNNNLQDTSTLVLNKTAGVNAVPGNLVVNGTVRLGASQQIADTADVMVNSGGLFDLGAYYEHINTLRGLGMVNFGSGSWIYLGLNNGSSTFDGSFTGIGYAPGFTVGKTGSGTFTMTGTNTFSAGNTSIGAGKMVINGYQPQSPVIVYSGATLGGSGTVGTIAAWGNISPGTSPGILTSSNVTFTSSGNFTVELTGPTPGSGYDQLNVTGTNILANATLTVLPAFTTPVAIGQKFIIINNDLSDAITGTFNGLAEGATNTAGGYKFTISYVGGTGNDVVLTLTSIPGAVTGSTVTSGNGSHSIDPNDCNNLTLVITNTTVTPMTGINATLSTTTEGVLITQPYATYPNIPANGSGTNIAPFQISTLPSFVCGNTINLQLIVNSSLGSFTMNYVLNTGESAAPTRFDNNTITNVPDIGTIESTNNVTSWSGGPITKVTVSLWLVAPIDSDLNLSLISPDGTTVPLSTANGAGANFGSGSADASRTTFDDSAAMAITAGSPPFVGTFRPQSPLSAFIGTSPNGAWRLHIQDSFGSGSPDTLRAWSLFLSGTSCNTGSGICDLCMPAITNAITLSDPVQTGRWIGNSVVASCGTPKTWPGTSAGSFHFDEYSFTNTSPADACVTVGLQSPSNILATAYLNSFDPANITANYLADAGNSTHGGQTTFSGTVPAGATFLVVVTEVIANAGTQPYILQLSGLPCPPPTLSIQPVPANKARLYWPTWAGGYLLESESNIVSSAWATITNEPIVGNHQYNVTNSSVSPTNRFYRLHKP
jgi:autotransporter-associated beta strand protein